MDSKRLQIRYSEDGGELKDGVVEIRRGVDDLSLGESHYAQVRILVDKTHYIKGMAVIQMTFLMVWMLCSTPIRKKGHLKWMF